LNAKNYTQFVSKYYDENYDYFQLSLQNQNLSYRLWVLKVIEQSGSLKSIPFLIDLLTDVDDNISATAYSVLKNITGKDYANDYNTHINSPEVIKAYRKYYLDFYRVY